MPSVPACARSAAPDADGGEVRTPRPLRAAAAIFGLGLVLTQHEAARIDGRRRTAIPMALVAVPAGIAITLQGGRTCPPRHRLGRAWMRRGR